MYFIVIEAKASLTVLQSSTTYARAVGEAVVFIVLLWRHM